MPPSNSLNIKMGSPLLSIIVPVYNTSKYLSRCLDSIIAQTFKDYEVIVIDDGSTDGSSDICDDYSYTDPRINVIHGENVGASLARKKGIALAKGKYIICCDSDDWIDTNMYRLMIEKALKGNYDMVICDYLITDGEKQAFYGPSFEEGKDYLAGLAMAKYDSSLWNKLIRADILNRSDFIIPKYTFGEDGVYSLQYTIYSKRIGYVNQKLYYYYQRPGSVTRCADVSAFQHRFFQHVENHKLFEEIMQDFGIADSYKEELILHRLKIKNSLRQYLSYKPIKELWRSTYPELKTELFISKYVPLRSIVSYYVNSIRAIL